MANTTNFGWETPDDTDLVKDGAAAIRTLGSAIDTSLVDLKGGTTGQLLSKASNTDMDFTWAAAGIPATIFDAKGDLIAASAADTAARLAVGSNDQVLTADSSTATGLKWATPSSGAYTLLSTTTLASTTTTISSISQSYRDLAIFIDNWTLNANVRLDISPNSDNSANRYRENRQASTYSYRDTTEIRPNTQTNNAATGAQNNYFMLYIYDYTNTSAYKMYFGTGQTLDTASARVNETAIGTFTSLSAISSLNIKSSNGTATIGGSVRIYGVK